MKSAPSPSRRRWFQFSLRDLFVFMTLLCLWLGWSMHWIRQRRAFLREPGGPEVWYSVEDGHYGLPVTVHAPGMLWLFGEHGVRYIEIPVDNPELSKRAARLFPEASITPPSTKNSIR